MISILLLIPLLGLLYTASKVNLKEKISTVYQSSNYKIYNEISNDTYMKIIGLQTSVYALVLSLFTFAIYDFSSNQFQFVQEYYEINTFNLNTGVDGLSIYFVLLTTIIIPISLLSNWSSISYNVKSCIITILLLDVLLLLVFLVLDIFLFYVFFESILPPLFILIGLFGSDNRVRASFYLFLYTLLGSLFLLLSILTMSSIMGTTDFDALYKINFNYYTQILLFCGIFIAFAVKTPTIFLNIWLLKAHVESPLSGSIILAAIVLKLSLYGIFRLILPLLPKAYINCTYFVYLIGVTTILYASISTLRTIDIKELIAYSSVSHAAVYLMGVFSNTVQGIEGGIALGLAHGFVSSGLFICAGGILYDRSSTRLITHYRGIAQIMPVFCIMFFILCIGNCGTPLTLNFVGEFLSLYGATERLPLLGVLASSSIIFSAAYTIYMFNRIAFAGAYSKFFFVNLPDINKREFYMLLTLISLTIILGIYPSVILDGVHYSVTTLIYDSPVIMLFIPLFRANTKYLAKIQHVKFLFLKVEFLLMQPKAHWYIALIMSFVYFILLNFYFTDPLHCMPNPDSTSSDYVIDGKKFCECNDTVKGSDHNCQKCSEHSTHPNRSLDGHQYSKSDSPVNSGHYCCSCGEIIQNQIEVECRNCSCLHHNTCQEATTDYINRTGGNTGSGYIESAEHGSDESEWSEWSEGSAEFEDYQRRTGPTNIQDHSDGNKGNDSYIGRDKVNNSYSVSDDRSAHANGSANDSNDYGSDDSVKNPISNNDNSGNGNSSDNSGESDSGNSDNNSKISGHNNDVYDNSINKNENDNN